MWLPKCMLESKSERGIVMLYILKMKKISFWNKSIWYLILSYQTHNSYFMDIYARNFFNIATDNIHILVSRDMEVFLTIYMQQKTTTSRLKQNEISNAFVWKNWFFFIFNMYDMTIARSDLLLNIHFSSQVILVLPYVWSCCIHKLVTMCVD